jgi:hypothetical protein
MEIWEPKTPGTLWVRPGLLRDCFTFTAFGIVTLKTSEWSNITKIIKIVYVVLSQSVVIIRSGDLSACRLHWVLQCNLHADKLPDLIITTDYDNTTEYILIIFSNIRPLTCFQSDDTKCCIYTI